MTRNSLLVRPDVGPAAFGTNPQIAEVAKLGARVNVDLLREPEISALFEAHILDCLAAGSTFLATDTFPARVLLEKFGGGKSFAQLVQEHLSLIIELHQKHGLTLPRSIELAFGPVGDCYLADRGRFDARACAEGQIALGVNNGLARVLADDEKLGVLFETVPSREKLFGTIEGILARIAKWPKAHKIPNFTVSLVVGVDGKFRDGDSAVACVKELLKDRKVLKLCLEGKLKFGLNCVDHQAVKNFFRALGSERGFFDYLAMNGADGDPWDAEAAAVRGEVVGVNPDRHLHAAKAVRDGVASRVGACCGLDHSDLRRIAGALR